MSIPYVTFMKHAEKLTKNVPASRPILTGVYHKAEGSLIVTDAVRLYVAKNAHSNESESVISPKTGEAIDGTYPDTTRLIPDKDNAKFTARIPVKESLDAFTLLLKACQVAGKGNELADVLQVEDNSLVFAIDNIYINATYKAGFFGGEIGNLTFNPSFMVDALKLFKDVGAAEIEFRYYGSMRPFTLVAGKDDDLLALILPVRKAVD